MKAKLIEFFEKMYPIFCFLMVFFTLLLLGFLINYAIEEDSIENNRKDSLKLIECLKNFTQKQCNYLNNK